MFYVLYSWITSILLSRWALKFGDLLPAQLLRDLVLARIADIPGARRVLSSAIRVVDANDQ